MLDKFDPRPYQILTIDHIVDNPRCATWVHLGGGKTASCFEAFDRLSLVEDPYPILVCATLRVARDTWTDEVKKWEQFSHLKVISVVGTPEERAKALRQKAHYYCTNYGNIPWLVEHLGENWPFKTIVSDESTKLRGFRTRQGTQRSHALFSKSFESSRFVELTGTPTPKGLQDLWAQVYFLDKGQRLGKSFEAFKQRWFSLSFDGFSIKPLPGAQEEIMSRIKDICLSIDPADYFDLEKPVINNIYVDLPKDARKVYKEMEKRMFVEIEQEGIEAFNAASRTNKCLQISNGAIYYDDKKNYKEIHNAKIEALEDMVEEYGGFPILVAYNFVADKERLMKVFPKALDLSKDKDLKAFKTGKHSIGIAHPASLGHGVDGLQKVTNIIVFFGHSWDLELYDQIIGRIGPVRQMQAGFKRPVFIHHIIARNTMDEAVMERRDSKREVQDILLDYMKRR